MKTVYERVSDVCGNVIVGDELSRHAIEWRDLRALISLAEAAKKSAEYYLRECEDGGEWNRNDEVEHLLAPSKQLQMAVDAVFLAPQETWK